MHSELAKELLKTQVCDKFGHEYQADLFDDKRVYACACGHVYERSEDSKEAA